jgi:D-alanine-D-alanine ligase-like ATP-grasp enzyme
MRQFTITEPQPYFHVMVNHVLQLFADGELRNVTKVEVEPEYGYAARLTYTNGSFRVIYGYDIGLNPSGAIHVVKDKGYTKMLLRTIGVNCPDGAEFLLPWWHKQIGLAQVALGNPNVRSTETAPEYVAQELGYPVYVKPIDGSKGQDVFLVQIESELVSVLQSYETKRIKVAVIEKAVAWQDYRVVCLDGRLISAYRRLPLAVTGDGRQTIKELLTALQRKYDQDGRDVRLDVGDPHITSYMAQHDLDAHSVPMAGQRVVLSSVSNLSAGGTSEDVTDIIDTHWVELTAFVAKSFSLRLVGLDLACADITNLAADYSVLEVNGSPGLDHYASSGEDQRRIVNKLYVAVLNALPASVA